MMREWRRLYRLHGYTPFGILLVVLLAVLVVADRVTDRWAAAAQRRDAVQQQLAAMNATLGRSRQIDTALESGRARLAAVAGRVLTAPDAKAAGHLLAQAAEKWLVSMGATRRSATGLEDRERSKSVAAVAEVSIRVVPQQLLRILRDWQQAPLAMRLVRLDLTVDNPDSPTSLEAVLQVQAVFQPPRTEEGAAPRPSGQRNATRQDSR